MATAPFAGQLVRASDAFGFTTFTPNIPAITAYGTGAVLEGWYQTLGQMVLWGFRIQFGSTAPTGTGTFVMDLPVQAYVGGGAGLQATVGDYTYRTNGATNHYSGSMGIFSSSGLTCNFNGAGTGANQRINNTVPDAIANAVVLSGSGVYRTA